MTKENFQPDRLKLIRCVHGVSQADLGNEIGVSRQFINQVEQGKRRLTTENLTQISFRFNVHVNFFYRAPTAWVERSDCNFRKFKTATKTFENQILAKATLLSEALDCIAQHVTFPAVNIPRLAARSDGDIETAAAACRVEWDLGEHSPIDNVTRVLENAGIVCANVDGIDRKISALSVMGPVPIVLHNVEFTQPSRYRFNLAHELGHFVIHRGNETGGEETERQADRFASAFLMPARAFVKEFPKPSDRTNWNSLAAVKRRWGVSFKAIARRALDLGLFDGRQYRSANIFLNSRGYAKREPFESEQCESPESINLALQGISSQLGIFGDDIGGQLGIRERLLSSILGSELPLRAVRKAQLIQFPQAQVRERRKDDIELPPCRNQ